MQNLDSPVSARTRRMVERSFRPLSRIVAKYKRQADTLEGKNQGFLMLPSDIGDAYNLKFKLKRLKAELKGSVRLVDKDECGFKDIFEYKNARTFFGRIKAFFSRPNPFEEAIHRASGDLIHVLGLVSVFAAVQMPMDSTSILKVGIVAAAYAGISLFKAFLVRRSVIAATPFLYIGHAFQRLTAKAEESNPVLFRYFKDQLAIVVDKTVAECEKVLANPVIPKSVGAKPERQ